MKFQLTSSPLENLNLKNGLAAENAGGFCAFEGWVRNENQGREVIALEYEAFNELCATEAEKILNEAAHRFKIVDAHCFHRTGKLKIGDMAVWVGVTAAHRDETFKACRYIIDELKARLPIWKKEYYTDGESEWLNGRGVSLEVRSTR